MHGNGVHNVGFNHPTVIAAARRQLDEELTFCPRRYTEHPGGAPRPEARRDRPGRPDAGSCCAPAAVTPSRWRSSSPSSSPAASRRSPFGTPSTGPASARASVGGEEHFRGGIGPLMPGAFHVEFPNYYRNPWGFCDPEAVDAECLRQIELVLRREPEMAAIIGEPVSANPVVPQPRLLGRGPGALQESTGLC